MTTGVAQFTRPNNTTAYTANDVVGRAGGVSAALEFQGMGPGDGDTLIIRGWSLRVDAAAVIASETTYTLHFYSVTPPSALADNAPFDVPAGDRAAYLGFLTSANIADLGSTLWVETNGLAKPVRPAGSSLFAYLVTAGAYTPTADRVYEVDIHVERAKNLDQ